MDSNPINNEIKWNLVEAALSLPRPLGITCALFSLIVLIGYLCNIEALYRPIAGGPATHPLTALSILFLGLGVNANCQNQRRSWLQRLLTMLALLSIVARLGEATSGTDLTSWITPFHSLVMLDIQAGKNNSMGVNSAIMLLLIALALGLYSVKAPKYSQFAASIAVAVPMVSFTGYTYGIEHFYGQMSLLTATTGFCLAAATLMLTADHAALRSILSPYIGGKIARLQMIAGIIIPIALGYMLVKSFVSDSVQHQSLFGLFVVIICWFVIMMVSMSSIFSEKVDFERRLNEAKLATAALSDSLTGLPNRRKFLEFGQHEVERVKRTGNDLWILMIDLDHFKKVNDTAGHDIGDRVLIAVGSLLSQSIRKVDLAGRLGGEEFAVLLADTNQEGCERVSENIRQNIALLQISGWTEFYGPITASIGCAKLSATDTLEKALRAADEALYQAKNNGRNQVSMIHT